MKRLRLFLSWSGLLFIAVTFFAQPAVADQPTPSDHAKENATEAAAAVASGQAPAPRTPDFLEHLVDSVLNAFNVKSSGNTVTHYTIAAIFVVGSFLLRGIVATWIFALLRKFAERTETTLDDKLFPAWEQPVKAFITVTGLFSALKVLKLSEQADNAVSYGGTIAFTLVVFWFLFRTFNSILEHFHEIALQRQMGIAAFMPWIKKTLIALFVIFGVLIVAQSLGYNVKAFLAGLGIGGLAFALAAQDTLANLFGSVVVAIDQPFKLGEFVQIGANSGTVEDIGLRSTKLRTIGKSLVIIPNKTVAAESIINLSRFTQRRVEQTLGLTYDATADQIEEIVLAIRTLLLAEPAIEKSSVVVQFTEFGAYSLNIWVVFNTLSADFNAHLVLKEKLNLAIMRLVAAKGLSFAFPTQTIQFDSTLSKQLASASTSPRKPA